MIVITSAKSERRGELMRLDRGVGGWVEGGWRVGGLRRGRVEWEEGK